jgi:hypothetical protein
VPGECQQPSFPTVRRLTPGPGDSERP